MDNQALYLSKLYSMRENLYKNNIIKDSLPPEKLTKNTYEKYIENRQSKVFKNILNSSSSHNLRSPTKGRLLLSDSDLNSENTSLDGVGNENKFGSILTTVKAIDHKQKNPGKSKIVMADTFMNLIMLA